MSDEDIVKMLRGIGGRSMAEAADEIDRLRFTIKRALLAVTVSDLTLEGYRNACAQAADILNKKD